MKAVAKVWSGRSVKRGGWSQQRRRVYQPSEGRSAVTCFLVSHTVGRSLQGVRALAVGTLIDLSRTPVLRPQRLFHLGRIRKPSAIAFSRISLQQQRCETHSSIEKAPSNLRHNSTEPVSYEPKVGDIVLFPGKWPGQRYFGIVEEVTTRDKSQISTVDIQPLERLGRTNKYVIDVRKKSVWRRGDELTPCDPVEYDEQNKIWLLPMVPSSTKPNPVKQPSPAARDHSLKEYARLKRWLMQGTLTTAALGTSYYVIRNGVAEALAFAAGSAASLLYLTLLQRSVDRLRPAYLEIEEEVTEHASNEASERPPAAPAFPVVRYALPFLLILGLFLVQKGSLTPREVFACILGFLSYKIPLWYVSIREYIDAAREHSAGTKTSPLASGEADSHGLLRALPQKVYPVRNLPNLSKTPPPVEAIVVTGPSGVGKSTLIARLLAEFPDHLGYSVSTTTRAPRPGEVNGVSYHFVSKEKFLADVAAGKFIEHACVYGNYYGTTVDAVRAVTQASPPRICLLSLDLQGVQTMMSGQSLEAFFVWIAPPSLAELERRLRERETESPADLHRRLDAARQEMEFAEKSANFDVRIVNDDFEVAYNKLRRVVLALLHGRR